MKSICASLILFYSLGSVDAQRQKQSPVMWTFGSSNLGAKEIYPGDRLSFTYPAPTHNVAILPDPSDSGNTGSSSSGVASSSGVFPTSSSGVASSSGLASSSGVTSSSGIASSSGVTSSSGIIASSSDGGNSTTGDGSEFDPCAQKAQAKILDTTGTYTWIAPLADKEMSYWLLCTLQDHCSAGNMKVKVTVKMPTHVVDKWDVDQSFDNMTLSAGDTLAFDYNGTDHDVQRFTDQTAYDNCDFSGATMECSESGPCTIKIGGEGEEYFGCSKADHCQNGNQKMAVTVESGAETVTASLTTVLLGALALFFTGKRM